MSACRRSNGEGSIRRLSSGRWQGQIMDGYNDDGKRKTRSFSGDTKKEVIEKIRDFYEQKRNPALTNTMITFETWATQWYESYQNQVQPSTYSGYKYTKKLLVHLFGNASIKDILPMHISNAINRLVKDGYSKSQITKCRAMLIQIFDAAEDNNLIARNPARKTKPVKDTAMASFSLEPQKDAFTEAECELLFAHLPEDLLGHSIRLILLTGLRIQELIALTADDITEDGALLNINKAIKIVDGKPMLGPTKSKRSTRRVPVPCRGRESAIYLRIHGHTPFIWSPSVAKPLYSIGSFRKRFYTAIQKIEGVRRLPPHSCRHTYITMLQAKGVPMENIARLAGHTDIATTDVYLHVSAEQLQKAVEVLSPVDNTDETQPTDDKKELNYA